MRQEAPVEREKLPDIDVEKLLDNLTGKMYRLVNDEYVRYTREELEATLHVKKTSSEVDDSS